ncbi:hypothetical protein [Amycolatopsis sp. PS_44_ISF1]|uniref:hypothetical protein n=1 Tax=Amycolatopsis sp. PS_44_ISF1 TaxID=2974917 RepID=UPI0028DD6894|nr:hypothetical protein [Amycolatopsis sp. PS_44_ISF1]MDT8913837.1 hypothetical protein [Amycolatopsis sp. PS_44_ISF1]
MGDGAEAATAERWAEVVSYVRLRYEILEEVGGWVRFRLDTTGGRDQQVTVHLVPEHDGAAWAEISSPVGWADRVDLRRLLELVGSSPVGGAAVVDGIALVRHTVPLGSLDLRLEFERPLLSVVRHADELERQLARTDEF